MLAPMIGAARAPMQEALIKIISTQSDSFDGYHDTSRSRRVMGMFTANIQQASGIITAMRLSSKRVSAGVK